MEETASTIVCCMLHLVSGLPQVAQAQAALLGNDYTWDGLLIGITARYHIIVTARQIRVNNGLARMSTTYGRGFTDLAGPTYVTTKVAPIKVEYHFMTTHSYNQHMHISQ